MIHPSRCRPLGILAAGLLLAGTAVAQSTTGTTGMSGTTRSTAATGSWYDRPSGGGMSVLPFTSSGYVGISVGQSNYDLSCREGFACNDDTLAHKIYTGGLLFNAIGLELDYVHMGKVDISGGRARAHGIGLTAVGNLPIDQINLFAKVGTTYGWTRTQNLPAGSGAQGRENGFGFRWGLGAQYNITDSVGVRAEWERIDFAFRSGRESVDLLSVGAVWRF